MSASGQEIEAKFYIQDWDRMITRLHSLEARLIQSRVLETNLRFDLPDASLRSSGRVLRLRGDTAARLTFKGASQNEAGVASRREIEFTVDDHDKARQFLEALGYRKSAYYEKYRTTYELDHVLIMLDELPYGRFLEIEGETTRHIRAAAASLNLDWDAAIRMGYMDLFEIARTRLTLSFRDPTFENFAGIPITPQDLGVRPAD